jgi:hypothetical protein
MIIHIWTGGVIPDNYARHLQNVQYRYLLLGENEWQKYTKLFADEQGIDFNKLNTTKKNLKSNILRFLYLYYNGGVYFDIDYEFNNSKCLNFIY